MRITVLGASLPPLPAPGPGQPRASPPGSCQPGVDRPGDSRPGADPARSAAPGSGPAEVSLDCRPGETVLSALSRQGVRVPSACQAGICRACLVRGLHGDPGPDGPAGLEDALRADGYFLACQARPASDLTVALAGGDTYAPARLLSVRREGPALRVRVRPERPLNFRAGQHVALRIPAGRDGTHPTRNGPDGDGRHREGPDRDGRHREGPDQDGRHREGPDQDGRHREGPDQDARPGDGPDGDSADGDGPGRRADLVRVYSFANGPDEADRDGAEFYVRVYPGGAMSTWLASARPGAELSLGRPSGTCCYQPGEPGAPLLLAGTGTGVAPLAAAARDALARGHHGPIVLLRGAADPSGLYPDEHLPPEPVRLRTCVLSRGEDIVAAAVAEYTALAGRGAPGGPPGTSLTPATCRTSVTSEAQVYLCGGPGVVARTRRALFLAGQSLRRIHCDAFSPAVMDSS